MLDEFIMWGVNEVIVEVAINLKDRKCKDKGPVTLSGRPVGDHLQPKSSPTTCDHWRPWSPKNDTVTLILVGHWSYDLNQW